MNPPRFSQLVEALDQNQRVLIQTHDFPDFDAIASAVGLSELLIHQGFNCLLVYGEVIQGYSLEETVMLFNLPMVSLSIVDSHPDDQVILVDSSRGNKNVTDIPGRLVGIVDHHSSTLVQDCPFWDNRPELGSCSSLVWSYFEEMGWQPTKKAATLMLMGIMMDTGYLTRGVSSQDLEALNGLYFLGDWVQGSFLLKNSLSVQSAPCFQEGLASLSVDVGGYGFAFVSQETSIETAALMADDFLRFHEIHYQVVVARHGNEYKVSVRSEDPSVPAGTTARLALEGLGSAGGHAHMGGGSIPLDLFPGAGEIHGRFRAILDQYIKGKKQEGKG